MNLTKSQSKYTAIRTSLIWKDKKLFQWRVHFEIVWTNQEPQLLFLLNVSFMKEWKSDQKTCKQTKDNNKTETATYERLKSREMCVEILKRDISVHPSYVGFVCFMIKKNWRNSHNFFSINVSSCRRSQSETIFFLSNPYNYLTLANKMIF